MIDFNENVRKAKGTFIFKSEMSTEDADANQQPGRPLESRKIGISGSSFRLTTVAL